MVTKAEQKVHESPRISVNKLAEYLATNKASRRERILKDAKFPPTFQLIRYDPTREMVQRYLAGLIPNTQALQAAIAQYEYTKTKDEFEARMKKSNLEAMGLFAALAPTLVFEGAKVTLGEHAPPKLSISDVAVSVRPDLNLTYVGKGGLEHGALKLNISKGAVHTIDSAEYAGALVRHFLTTRLGDDCDHKRVFVLDIFGKKISPSPKATVNRMKDVEAACAEIARQWDSIKAA